jgi:exodeoxyribonuclease V alpha subunit
MNESVKLKGTVEHITYQNPNNSYTVLDFSADSQLITCVGIFPNVFVGERLELTGKWTTHTKYGEQFSVISYVSNLQDSSGQLYRFLSSGIISGVREKTAMKIIETFGDDAYDVLENHPERLCQIKGISREKADKISMQFQSQFAIRNVMLGLERYGVTPAEGINIFKELGANAVTIVELNPYILCNKIYGFDFARCEKIALEVPHTVPRNHRFFACIDTILRNNYNNGHTCMLKKELVQTAFDMLQYEFDDTANSIDQMIDEKVILQENFDGVDYVFTNEAHNAEKSIAAKLLMLLKFPAAAIAENHDEAQKIVSEKVFNMRDESGFEYEEKQRDAIISSAMNGIIILTGGPGTGKTTTLKGMIKLFEELNMDVVLAAPTGRAAKRLTEVTGKETSTIHRLLEAEFSENEESVFCKNVFNPIDADVVIIDEMSMVDTFLFNALLDALRIGTRLILVGDSDQLPSVGPGNVLHDMINSEQFPVITLTEIFRQADSSLIVRNAHSIIGGNMPILDDVTNDFFFLERTNPDVVTATVGQLVSQRLPDAYDYDAIDDIQVLTPSKIGKNGTVILNNKLQELLNPHSEKKQEHRMPTRVLRVGDKIMQTKNNYDLEWEKLGEMGTGIYNGDMGRILKISHASKTMTIDFDGRVTHYPMDKLEDIELAYAVTIHKSQGSEYPAVVIPLFDAPTQLLYRNLIYTGVTRAKNLLIIVGSSERLKFMIENNKKINRNTGLFHFLTEKNDMAI